MNKEQALIDQVRQIHKPDEMQPRFCNVCLDYYPCETIKVLDGDKSETV